jgi:hypothetical protein
MPNQVSGGGPDGLGAEVDEGLGATSIGFESILRMGVGACSTGNRGTPINGDADDVTRGVEPEN